MPYIKTVWVNDQQPYIDEDNLNKIEQGIYDADARSLTNETNISNLDDRVIEVENSTNWDETTKVRFKRKTTSEISSLPIEDGSLLYNVENGKTYLDFEDERISTGGGSGAVVGETPPLNPELNDLWVDTLGEEKLAEVDSQMSSVSANPVQNKIVKEYIDNKISPIESSINNGWISINDTLTYASATTITVPSGATNKYAKGDRLKITQDGGIKYFYIIGVADTLLTITAGSSYTLTSTAITLPYYSKDTSPSGFPSVFGFVSAYTGFSANPNINFVFNIIGTMVKCNLVTYAVGTSNSSLFTMTLPAVSVGEYVTNLCIVTDNGTKLPTGYYQIDPSSNIIQFFKDVNKTGFTASGQKSCEVIFFYSI